MTKSVFNFLKNTKTVSVMIVAGFLMISMPSCKHQEDCGAYQGSHKSSRSHKKHHRHASVISVNTTLLG